MIKYDLLLYLFKLNNIFPFEIITSTFIVINNFKIARQYCT